MLLNRSSALHGAPETQVERRLRWLFIGYLVLVSAFVALSPFLAAVLPVSPVPAQGARLPEGLGWLLVRLPLPDPALRMLTGGGSLIPQRLLSTVLLIFQGAGALFMAIAVWVVARHPESVHENLLDRIVRGSLCLAIVMALATPVNVGDFWLSLAWGREVAMGGNPYLLAPVPAQLVADLPVGRDLGQMTYGPAWAMLSGGLMWVTRGDALLGAVAFKLVILLAWLATLRITFQLTHGLPSSSRATAMLLLGWSPLALFHGLADGHNDVVFVCPLLLWMMSLERMRPIRSALGLAGSIGIKYVSAPLVALHGLHALRWGSKHRRAWVVGGALALGCLAIAFVPFVRSGEFLQATAGMRAWRFFTPAAAIDTALDLMRWPGPAVGIWCDRFLLVVGSLLAVRAVLVDSGGGLRMASLWLMSAVLFGAVGHVWPWFLLWVLPLAVLNQGSRLSWFIVGLAVLLPLALIPWTTNPRMADFWRVQLPGLAVYVVALAGAWWLPRRLRRLSDSLLLPQVPSRG